MRYYLGRKRIQKYKGLVIKADLDLHHQIATRLQSELAIGSTILDLGAGEGALSARLSDLGYKVTAVDLDEENFGAAGVPFSKVDFDDPAQVAEFGAANSGCFDAVLGIEVIEHVQDQWSYVRQLLALVRPGGLVLITTPNTTSWLSRFIFLLTGRFHQFADEDLAYGHISPITPWELELILTKSGAQNVSLRPAGTLPMVYLTGLNKVSLMSLFALPLRVFMRGIVDGWCVMATGRRPLQ